MKMKVIMPRELIADAKKLSRAIENGLTGAAKAVRVEFGVTEQTWKNKAEFEISFNPGERTISTDSEIYGFVNDGTKPHVIVAKGKGGLVFGTPSRAKTTPRVIGSGAGSRGSTIVHVQKVNHPGTDAREFDAVIAEKWEKELAVILQRSVDSEVS